MPNLTSVPAMPDTHNPAMRGYHAVYREHQVNHCPGCGRTHWYIGRLLAECAFCALAMPLDQPMTRGVGTRPIIQHRNGDASHAWAA